MMNNTDIGFLYISNPNFVISNNQRIKVADYLNDKEGKRLGLDAPYGFREILTTPWGVKEECVVTIVPSLAGRYEEYATISNPKSNPGVRFSCFPVNRYN